MSGNDDLLGTVEAMRAAFDAGFAEAPPAVRAGGAWKDLRSIGMVVRTRTVNGVTGEEIVYYLSSLPAKVKAFAKAVRAHWGIENQLHWTLDVTFSEDHSRVRRRSAHLGWRCSAAGTGRALDGALPAACGLHCRSARSCAGDPSP